MIESADWLCEKHFGKTLIDQDVEILDPATGTGTFICELLEHFRGQPAKLAHKYKEELHANEVAILPYYVANLNIEATYAAITGQYRGVPEPLLRRHARQRRRRSASGRASSRDSVRRAVARKTSSASSARTAARSA